MLPLGSELVARLAALPVEGTCPVHVVTSPLRRPGLPCACLGGPPLHRRSCGALTVEGDLVVDALLDKVASRAQRGVRNWTTTEIRAATEWLAHAIGLDMRRARQEARRRRWVVVQDSGSGMASLIADLPAEVVHRIYRRLTEIARNMPVDDRRCRDERRADALADLVLEPLQDAPPTQSSTGLRANPAPGRVDASARHGAADVGLVIDLPALLGLLDEPGVIPGFGPIDSDIARELAADRTWRLWLRRTATGPIVATSATTYRPPGGLARLIRARDPYCRMPGCRTPASACDLDHVRPLAARPHGGTEPRPVVQAAPTPPDSRKMAIDGDRDGLGSVRRRLRR